MNYIEEPTYSGGTEIRVCHTVIPQQQATFAMELMKNLAIAAATPDGEDSSGRAKLRLMTEAEIVSRATLIAQMSWDTFKDMGWILEVPMPKPRTRGPLEE